jgi:hypothetical protein
MIRIVQIVIQVLATRLVTEFCSEKIPRNRLGMASVIWWKKVLIPRHSEVYGRVNSEARNGRKWPEKNKFYTKSFSSKQNRQHVFVRDMLRKGIPRVCCSTEWFRMQFREFASIFVPWYRIPSIFLHCGTVRNGIPRVFCSAEFRRNKPIVPSIPSSAATG